MKEIADIVERTIPLQIAGVRAAIEINNQDHLALSLHRLKGSLCHICTGAILDKMHMLEELALHPRGAARISFQLVAIERTVIYLMESIRKRIRQNEIPSVPDSSAT